MASPAKPSTVSFGVYEFNPDTKELRKQGIRVRLEGQPLAVLQMLLERPGELVTREELQKNLWRAHTFVDFEHSLNAAVKRLRERLNDSADQPRFIETLARRGYRFVAPVNGVVAVPESETAVQVSGESPPSARGAFRARRLWLFAAVALAAAGTWYLRSGNTAQIDSIAVIPFINVSGDANTEYLSDGIAELLTDSLTHVPQLKVKSRRSAFQFKGKDVNLQKVGNDLGVSALVSGRIVHGGDNIEVNAELTDVRSNTEIWGQHYSGKSTEIISLQEQIAGDIAAKLRSKLSSSEKQRVSQQGTQNPDAYELYLKGRYYWNKRTVPDLETSISYFGQAIAKDPGYALAYSGLGDAYSILPIYGASPSENYPKSNAAARKALELDATLARSHAVLGSNEMEFDWDFAGGEAEYKKAFELDPNDATAHHWYANDIGRIGGREQEALTQAKLAYQLDPLLPITSMVVGGIHIWARRYDEAILACKKLANENPTFAPAHDCLASAYWGKRMYPKVIEEFRAYDELSGDRNESDFSSALEKGFRLGGWKAAETKAIKTLLARRKTSYASPFLIASLYADLGESDQAFRWLNIAYQEHEWRLISLKTELTFDSLRSDPRFAELIRKVGLPQ